MKQAKQPPEISFFRASLLDFLKEYHPHLTNDSKLIELRNKASEELFEELILGGADQISAYEQAMQELYAGMEFSLYSFIMDIICEEYTQVPAGKRRDLCLVLIPACEDIVDQYRQDSVLTDEIGHWVMQMEITGLIGQYLEEHGI